MPHRLVDDEPSVESERRATAIAPANIALIKYWGNKPSNLPYSDTISLNLSNCTTETTLTWKPNLAQDSVIIDHQPVSDKALLRIIKFLDEIRSTYNIKHKAEVISRNNFPMGVGIASSASGFSALALAATAAAGLEIATPELSTLARLGSGSASRSIPDGFVIWHAGQNHQTSFAESLYPPDYWDLRDFVVIVSEQEKQVGSADGHKLAHTSPLFETRIKTNLPRRLEAVLQALKTKDIQALGETVEQEARELHQVALTSTPSIVYAIDKTLQLTDHILPSWRRQGIPAYFTLDAGPNVHIIVPGGN
ncbi:MAG: diphosphomevalonate decarboxylase, partial [Candidatus Chisholmbacteria bacterium]|nr:diphosphomevalonate decarboxylase [Candidatus Chisholmbacteria bacterium]